MLSEHAPTALRRQVRVRARGLCEYCRCPDLFTSASFHCEHMTPREAGGETTLDDLAWACPWCNTHKYTKTRASDPQTGRIVPLFNPRRQRWERHFAWGEEFIVIPGRTAIGRATVAALHLNRPELLNLRGILRTAGERPPRTD
jgi:5-methylcytosine-specific restriction endonuclease McrA